MTDATDCCCGPDAETPRNRPGLPALGYRIDRHAGFRRRLLAALAKPPALRGLRTRDADDGTVAMCDAAAVLADILAFYQERLANEAFVRTATDETSVRHLARLIGYEPSPGVAADTHLAVTVEAAAGSPDPVPIAAGLRVQSVPGPGETAQTYETTEDFEARKAWNAATIAAGDTPVMTLTSVTLEGVATQLKPGDAILLVTAVIDQPPRPPAEAFRHVSSVEPNMARNLTTVRWAEAEPLGADFNPPTAPECFAFRMSAPLYGHTAPPTKMVIVPPPSPPPPPGTPPPPQTRLQPRDESEKPFDAGEAGIEGVFPNIAADTRIVIRSRDGQNISKEVKGIAIASANSLDVTARVTVVTLKHHSAMLDLATIRKSTAYFQSEALKIASAVTGPVVTMEKPLGGVAAGRRAMLALRNNAGVLVRQDLVEITQVDGDTITIANAVANPDPDTAYLRHMTTLNLNVIGATHGESVREDLAPVAAGVPFQQFRLRQPPLTHVGAATAAGRASTLRLFVRDVRWHETPALFGAGPADHVYSLRREDDGATSVRFGDGASGAVPPAGEQVLRAEYRKGLGRAGRVKAGQLTLLQSRPLGVNGAVNPADATGGEDPESLADARRNAPQTVVTLGRAVALADYEAFARSFAGVAKALATPTRIRGRHGVFLTVAGPGGETIEPSGPTGRNLVAALRAAGDPLVEIALGAHARVTFGVRGRLKVDADFVREKVVAAVEAALAAAFSFEVRAFAQPVALGEVIAVIQDVGGVAAVDVDALYTGATIPAGGPPARLLAAGPAVDALGNVTAGSELLSFSPAPNAWGIMP